MKKIGLRFILSIFACLLLITSAGADLTGSYVYVGNKTNASNSISVVDIEDDLIFKTIYNVYGPEKIFVSPDGLQSFVVSKGSPRKVSVIDTVTHTIVKPRLEGMAQAKTIAISPDSSRLFVAAYNPYQAWTGGQCRFGGGIHTFDTSTYQHLSCFDATESYAAAMSVRLDGKYLYADLYYNRNTSIRIYDIDALLHVKSLSLYSRSHSYHRVKGMAQDPAGKYVYVTGQSWVQNDWCPRCDSYNFGYLYTIDMLTNEVVQTVTVPVSQLGEITVSPDGLYAAVIDTKYNRLYIFNLQDYTYRSVDMGEKISNNLVPNLIIGPNSSFVYLLKQQTYKIAVVDLKNALAVGDIALSSKPYQMVMTEGGNYIYVTIPSLNKVSVIEVESHTIVKDITGFFYPSPIALVSIKNNPPEVDAGSPLIISSYEQDSIIIQGNATDSDGDTLAYRWLSNGEELLPWSPVGIGGEAYLDLSSVPYFSAGEYLLTLEVDDGNIISSNSMTLTVGNSNPVVSPSGAGTYQINTIVSLRGQVSDFDGDLLTYQWVDGETILFTGEIQTVLEGIPVDLPEFNIDNLSLGIHTISLIVNDGINESVTSDIIVEVMDSIAPTLAPITDRQILWPPNHSMVDITIEANAYDNAGGVVTLSATAYSNEAENGLGDGDTGPDWTEAQIDQINGIITLQLRAERFGNGNSREYTVIIEAVDDSGNVSSAQLVYIVPHDKRKK